MTKMPTVGSDHVGAGKIEEFIGKFVGGNQKEKLVTEDFMEQFYQERTKQLEVKINELQEEVDVLEKEVMQDIQNILLTKGSELLGKRQLLAFISRECGYGIGVLEAKKWREEEANGTK